MTVNYKKGGRNLKKWGKFPGVMIFWGVLMMTGISGGKGTGV